MSDGKVAGHPPVAQRLPEAGAEVDKVSRFHPADRQPLSRADAVSVILIICYLAPVRR